MKCSKKDFYFFLKEFSVHVFWGVKVARLLKKKSEIDSEEKG